MHTKRALHVFAFLLTLTLGPQALSLPPQAISALSEGVSAQPAVEIVNQAHLQASDGADQDGFGSKTAIWGETLAVGAPKAESSQGAVYIFTRSGETWAEQDKLTLPEGSAGDEFGRSVTLFEDTLVVGAPGVSAYTGSAYVFKWNPATSKWENRQTLSASDKAENDYFGGSVAIWEEMILVGASNKNELQGAAYAFRWKESNWQQVQKLTGDEAGQIAFGSPLALWEDTLLVGASLSNGGMGAAYVYQWDGTSWQKRQTLTASDATGDTYFSASVAIWEHTILVGAFSANNEKGAAYVFDWNGLAWEEAQILTAMGTTNFGMKVSIFDNVILVGDRDYQVDPEDDTQARGAAFVFVNEGSSWSQQKLLRPDDSHGFGTSTAIHDSYFVVGAPEEALNELEAPGAAYVYRLAQAPAFTSSDNTTFNIGTPGMYTITTTGHPTPTITYSGTLPAGVDFEDHADGTAAFSGTPAAGTAGIYTLTLTAANGIPPNDSQTFTLRVVEAPAITSPDHTTFIVGSFGSFIVTTSGSPPATITYTGELPDGVAFIDQQDGTATLSGTPATVTAGDFELEITASNDILPDATQTFTLVVEDFRIYLPLVMH